MYADAGAGWKNIPHAHFGGIELESDYDCWTRGLQFGEIGISKFLKLVKLESGKTSQNLIIIEKLRKKCFRMGGASWESILTKVW